jgi:hypothetical protein
MSWYLPAALLVVAGVLTIHSWRDTRIGSERELAPRPATARPTVVIGLAMVGAVPFAALGWTAGVPALVALLAAGLTALIVKDTRHAY